MSASPGPPLSLLLPAIGFTLPLEVPVCRESEGVFRLALVSEKRKKKSGHARTVKLNLENPEKERGLDE